MTNFFPPGDTPEQNFDKLNALLNTLFGGKSVRVRFGSGTVTFTASSSTPNVTVNHGLGVVPQTVLVVGDNTGAANCLMMVHGNLTATSFQCGGVDWTNTARTGNNTFYWIAIG